MTDAAGMPDARDRRGDAWLAAAVFALDPAAAGGLALRARSGPTSDLWIAGTMELVDPAAPVVKLPIHAQTDRIVGGLDLETTLRTGRPVGQQGLLAAADGGILVIPMAERLSAETAAAIGAALENGFVHVEREGLSLRGETRFGILALDEGAEPEEGLPPGLRDRIGAIVDLDACAVGDLGPSPYARSDIVGARRALASVAVGDAGLEQICAFASALGIDSIRPAAAAGHWARSAAAMRGGSEPSEAEILFVCRTILLPHANRIPLSEDPADAAPPEPDPGNAADSEAVRNSPQSLDGEAGERVVDAERAVLPPHLLALLDRSTSADGIGPRSGRATASSLSTRHGRPAGVRVGKPGSQGRLNLVETLRSAAPWQRLRTREGRDAASPPLELRRSDFRVNRYKQRIHTTTIFVVDASGSTALHRLAEAKGAIELLLAESYIRRDEVALIAFRGNAAELLLPPTRAIARAKRGLSGLPGGGGTPVATGLDAALKLALAVRAKGNIARLVVLTDGRANVALDGMPGRERAEADAISGARAIRRQGVDALFVDIARNRRPFAGLLAREMGARYLFMPRADSARIHASVRHGTPAPSERQVPAAKLA